MSRVKETVSCCWGLESELVVSGPRWISVAVSDLDSGNGSWISRAYEMVKRKRRERKTATEAATLAMVLA